MVSCIVNKIPIFVTGKPGCSKSLAVNLIISALKGRYAENSYIQQLPQIYPKFYQGHQQSTSEKIYQLFEDANSLQ